MGKKKKKGRKKRKDKAKNRAGAKRKAKERPKKKTREKKKKCPCPATEIQVNNTSKRKDDLVPLKCQHPSRRTTINCRIRVKSKQAKDTTVVLTNPDGRLRFPAVGDITKTLTVPKDKSWVSFQISGESPSNSVGDAIIEAHCDSATGPLSTKKKVTVFWFDQAEIKLKRGGNYSFVGNLYTVSGGVAVSYESKARIRPAGVDCSVPQVKDLKIGIIQEVTAYSQTVTWGNPTFAPDPTAPSGQSFNVPTTITETITFDASVVYPVPDNDAFSTPLYDRPGGGRLTLDRNSLKKPIGCQTGGATAPATSYDTPTQGAAATVSANIKPGANLLGIVTWTRIGATRDEDFRTYCVVFNDSSSRYCALREATWSIHINSTSARPQRATVSADAVAVHDPATGTGANAVPHVTTRATTGTKAFTTP